MFRLLRLYLPPDAIAPGGPAPTSGSTGELGKEDVIELLGVDDPEDKETIDLGKGKDERPAGEDDSIEKEDEEEGGKGKEKEGEEDEEIDELAEIEEELKEPTEEQLELMSPVSRREILKKYPNLFKDFPYLERSYYREREYTELLPTIDDAKVAVEKSQILDAFEADVRSGNIKTILEAVANDNPEGMARIADNYLSTLAAVDEKAYLHVLGNTMKHTIASMVKESKRSNNEALLSAATILNQFIFGTSEYTPPSQMAREKKPDDKETEVSQREQQLARQQFDNTVGTLNEKVNNVLKNTVEANIDPRDSMTPFVRKNAVRDVMEQLETLVTKDSRFRQLTDRLWMAAMKDGYSKASVDRIKSAYLAKAKSLLPPVIKKARNEALKGMGKKVERGDDSGSSSRNRAPITPGRPRSDNPTKITKAKDIPQNMTTLDFLSSD